jgi:hypothetical protein
LVFDVDQGDPWSPITSTPAIAVESGGISRASLRRRSCRRDHAGAAARRATLAVRILAARQKIARLDIAC